MNQAQIAYPVYVRDEEGWISFVASQDNLGADIEPYDAMEGHCTGWDSTGRTLRVVLDDKGWRLVDRAGTGAGLSAISDVSGLVSALLNYARMRGVYDQLVESEGGQLAAIQPAELWAQISSLIESKPTWIDKILGRSRRGKKEVEP